MSDYIKIKLNIADRLYPLTIERSQEIFFRDAVKKIESSLKKLEEKNMHKHFCNKCESEFDGPPKYQIEEAPNELIADGLILVERGQYICIQCSSIIGEYRVFENKV